MSFKLASAQYPITCHNSLEQWQSHVEFWVTQAVESGAKILVFPEYGSLELLSLLSPEAQKDLQLQIQELQRFLPEFLSTYQNLSSAYDVYIVAPSIPVIDKKIVNRAYVFNPEGHVAYQDKLTMTRFEDEDWGVAAADPILKVFKTAFGNFGISICFDSEFSQFGYELAQNGVELLLVPSCTETMAGLKRVHVGSAARALENQMIVVASSVVGDAEWTKAVDFNTGQACVFAPPDRGFPDNGIVALGQLNQSQWLYCDIDLNAVKKVRTDGAVFNFKKSNLWNLKNKKLKIEKIPF